MTLFAAVPDAFNPEDVANQLDKITASGVFSAVITAVVCVFVIRLLLALADRAFSRTKMDPTVRKLLRMILRAALYFIAVIIVLGRLGIEVTSLVAVLSLVGLAFSLAMQNFLSNVAGGMQLFASRPFKPGDWVEIGGCSGTVAEIDMFYTKLNTLDNKLVQLPNSSVMSSTVINYTSEDLRRLELKCSASYDAPTGLVLDTLRAMVTGHPLALTDREIFVHVSNYADSAIEYVARVWCKNADYWTIYFDLMDELKNTFDAAGIEITYPHLNVHLDPAAPAPRNAEREEGRR